MTFDIIRGASPIGRAEVVSVHPRVTACRIARTESPESFHVGDVALQTP
jgi:hypothetical protein